MSRDEYAEDLHAELGYRTAGQREVRQREWFSLRGDHGEPIPTPGEFVKLVNRLRVLRWQKANPERKRAKALRYARKPEARALQASHQGNVLKRRREAQKLRAEIFTCPECGAQWCKAPWTRGLRPTFCGTGCYQRAKYHRDHPGARRNRPTRRVYARKHRGAE